MLKNNIKIAWRNLTKRKGLTFINITGLSLGFACSVLIFLFVDHHLNYDGFHANSDRIYRGVTEIIQDDIRYLPSVPPGFAHAFRTDYDFAEKVAKIVRWDNELVTLDGDKKLKADVAFVEPEFLEIFNFPLLIGQQDNILKSPNTAVITEGMAKRLFDSQSPIGQTFKLGAEEIITVVGVLKDLPKATMFDTEILLSFSTISAFDAWASEENWNGITTNLQCFTLLHPGQNIDQVEQSIASFVTKYLPKRSENKYKYKLQPLSEIHFDSTYSEGMNANLIWIFSLIGLFLIVIAAINFINISSAQSLTRSKEVGIRKVSGSQRGHLFWQFIAETFIITLLSLLLGLGLSSLVLPNLNSLFGLELSVYGLFQWKFITLVCMLLVGTTVLAGSYPGMLLARIIPALALKGKLTNKDMGGYITRKVLVITQFSISLVLIIGTFVVSKQINYAIHSDLGFDREGIVTIALPDTPLFTELDEMKYRVSNFAGVEGITACYATPGAAEHNFRSNLNFNNNPERENFSIIAKIGDEHYLKTFGLKLIAGRNFNQKDSVDAVVVNAMLATKLGLQSPDELVGKPISIDGRFIQATIVGVLEDFHDQNFHGEINPIYVAPVHDEYNTLAVKINLQSAQTVLSQIEEEWLQLYPDYIFEYNFLDESVASMYESEQQFLSLTKVFSFMAIFIGCLGIYGLILFFVIQKTKEIGIRKVLGSNVFQILILLVKEYFQLIIIAGVIATPVSWYLMDGWLENYAYRTELSWWIFALAIVILLGITLLTIGHQAVKAALTNPVKSLRTE